MLKWTALEDLCLVANDIDASVLRKMRDAFIPCLMHLQGDDTQFLHLITISHAQNPSHRTPSHLSSWCYHSAIRHIFCCCLHISGGCCKPRITFNKTKSKSPFIRSNSSYRARDISYQIAQKVCVLAFKSIF